MRFWSIPARRRGSLLLAAHGRRREAAGSLRAQLGALDRRFQDVGSGGSGRPPSLRSRPRAVSHPDLGCHAARALRSCAGDRPEPCGERVVASGSSHGGFGLRSHENRDAILGNQAGEPIPFLAAERDDRVWRSGLMSLTLSERGHDVVFWGSQFDHMRKRFRDAESDRLIARVIAGAPIWCSSRRPVIAETSGCVASGITTGWPRSSVP